MPGLPASLPDGDADAGPEDAPGADGRADGLPDAGGRPVPSGGTQAPK
jgi:hypothetical protein